MLEVTITGVPPFDGTHGIDTDIVYNGRELHWIKEVAGVRLGEIDEAARAGDYDLVVALAIIALVRNSRLTVARWREALDVLMEAEGGKISVDFVEEEADAGSPPAETTMNEPTENSDGS